MKKVLLILLTLTILCCTMFCVPVSAASLSEASKTTIEYLDNGDYIETIIKWEESDTRTTKSGSKTANYKNSNGDVLWYIKVTGTFTYNGTTSSCTSSSHSAVANSSSWSIKSASSSKSGNTATARATATFKVGSTSQDYTRSVSLSCSANGTLS